MGIHSILSFVALFLLAGGLLLQFFVILSGGAGFPANTVYFLEADTEDIGGEARATSRWTFWALCGVDEDSGRNGNCRSVTAALPFDPPGGDNFDTDTGVPDDFLGTNRYFYLSRFSWAFYIIALFFAVVAFIVGLLALCSRLGSYVSAVAAVAAFFFQALAASLMTAWTVEGRNIFEDAGIDAKVGVRAYAFTWTALACFLLATIIFCLSGRLGKGNRGNYNNDSSYYNNTAAGTTSNPYDTTSVTSYERTTTTNANAEGPHTMRTGGRFVRFKQFGRKNKADRQRGSFAAKDEYA